MKPNLHQCNSILILCPIGIGNFLMVQPALENLSRMLGKEKLSLLALKPGIAEMATQSGLCHKVVSFFPDQESPLKAVSSLLGLRRKKYDATISLFPSGHWKYGLFIRLIGAPIRIGFSYPNSCIAEKVNTFTQISDSALHDVEQNLALISELVGSATYTGSPFPGKVHLKSEDAPKRYFVCHPGSSTERGMDKKRFKPEVFAALILALYNEFQVRCYLAGDPSEKPIRDAIVECIEQLGAKPQDVCCTIPCKSLGQLSGVLERSLFYLGNDSGIMHMSVAEKKRCIVLFGPTSEIRTGPYYTDENIIESEHLIIRDRSLSCAPCWGFNALGKNKPCQYGDYRCTTVFDPMDHWDEIKSFALEIVG
jgi:ADP-heptose:LPS heptosyltransferase